MPNVILYHNPRCSKSRETLALLRKRGVEPTIIEYLTHPLSATTLKTIIKQLGIKPRDLLRTKETAYQSLGLDDASLSDANIIEALVKNPILIERPIVVAGSRAVIGRPPENVLGII